MACRLNGQGYPPCPVALVSLHDVNGQGYPLSPPALGLPHEVSWQGYPLGPPALAFHVTLMGRVIPLVHQPSQLWAGYQLIQSSTQLNVISDHICLAAFEQP